MRNALAPALGLFISGTAWAQEPPTPAANAPDPRTILQKTAEAIGRLRTVSYDLDYKVSGWFSAFLPNVSGRVVMGKETQEQAKRFRCTAKVQKADSSEVVELTAGADGNVYYLIDDKARTVYADMDPQVLGKHRDSIELTLIRELGMARPFEDTLKSGEIRFAGEEQVDGHDCWVVFFKSSPMMPGMDWYFSKKDFLPRRVRFTGKDPQGNEGSGEATLKNLKIDPTFEKDPFALVVPEGYKRTDDFAP